jgi:hypothetical protein
MGAKQERKLQESKEKILAVGTDTTKSLKRPR